ncbi:hypothetical protein CA265_06670 [Sphingobacteriaceae bacterium GW460-11-11-14-LB5]|nr:hypothetical protein CA265_06670 [Sphingobacteriaceae bacterium GW460-11-11-14-LB5]
MQTETLLLETGRQHISITIYENKAKHRLFIKCIWQNVHFNKHKILVKKSKIETGEASRLN